MLDGILEDMDHNSETTLSDPRLRYHFARVDKLPKLARNAIISVIQAIIVYFETS